MMSSNDFLLWAVSSSGVSDHFEFCALSKEHMNFWARVCSSSFLRFEESGRLAEHVKNVHAHVFFNDDEELSLKRELDEMNIKIRPR